MTPPARRLPPPFAQLAIVLGFLLGTWFLLDSVHHLITGTFLQWRSLAPTAHAAVRLGVPSATLTGWMLISGVLWMLLPNLYLFQNRRPAWTAMLALALASLWYVGWATPFLLAVCALLLLSAGEAGFNARGSRVPPAEAASGPAHR